MDAVAGHFEEDDRLREPDLRDILIAGDVHAVAYPTHGCPDVFQVFLRGKNGAMALACVVVTSARLRDMHTSAAADSFSLQVVQEQSGVDGVRDAVQAWIARCFPGLGHLSVTLELWVSPED